ncbi:hypothetical protein [Halobacteriovorax sp. JY17]|uniref:hypothetical protein n=1 Tax=Halobacteriovorax sp. JY17 TaxID=2014617 RepID=UPI0025B8FC56|nr:hypothetical protein [Halobacteriovorax sp. JY17]
MDTEMLTFFVDEIKQIRNSMTVSISSLIETKLADSSKFEEVGQMVDRIYGTAATLGLTEISEYTKAVKDVSYMASASENEAGKKKVLKFLIKYVELSDLICESIFDKKELSKINLQLKIEKSKANLLNQREFFSVQKKSCAIE